MLLQWYIVFFTPPPLGRSAICDKMLPLAEVVFKDFEVGKVFRRRLQLTNVSYTVNHCKLLGLSEHLKDFITIDFNPPGSMSAGLTCHMNVTFEPKGTAS